MKDVSCSSTCLLSLSRNGGALRTLNTKQQLQALQSRLSTDKAKPCLDGKAQQVLMLLLD